MPGRMRVGLLVKDEWHSRCSVVYPIPKQEDILVVCFQRHRNIPVFVVCLYIPTNDEPKPCRQAAFSELLELTRSLELQGHVVIMGDCNGHLVPAPSEAPRGTNSNGKLLVQFLLDAGMLVTNEADSASFKPIRFMGSVGTTLDYIIVDTELAPKCNCTVEQDLTIDSNHHFVHSVLWVPSRSTKRISHKWPSKLIPIRKKYID